MPRKGKSKGKKQRVKEPNDSVGNDDVEINDDESVKREVGMPRENECSHSI